MNQGSAKARRKAETTGRRSEWLSSYLLMLKGYRILYRRYRNHAGEIDIIAKRGALIAFIEVKARRSRSMAFDAVTPHTRRRIERASELFFAHHNQFIDCDRRYDIIAVSGLRFEHRKSAWRAGD